MAWSRPEAGVALPSIAARAVRLPVPRESTEGATAGGTTRTGQVAGVDLVAAVGRALAALGTRLGIAYLSGPAVVAAVSPERFAGGRIVTAGALGAYAAAVLLMTPGAMQRVRLACLFVVATVATVLYPLAMGGPGADRVDQVTPWLVTAAPVALTLAGRPWMGLLALGVLQLCALAGAAAADSGTHEMIGPALGWALCALVVVVVQRGLAVTGATLTATESALVAQRVAHRTWCARRLADRTLHDTVLATLAVLSHGSRGLDPEDVRAACAHDAALLRAGSLAMTERDRRVPSSTVRPQPGGQRDALGEHLNALIERSRVSGLYVRLHGHAPGVRDDIAVGVLLPAVTECLKNVLRHAGVAAADIVVQQDANAVSVVVVDEGIGFDPADVPSEHLGLAASVRDRLSDASGSATVWSSPGRGTTVMLRLPLGAAAMGAE